MRREPGTNSGVVKSVRDGTEVIIIGTDREADGRIWRNVQDGEATGWIVSTALRAMRDADRDPAEHVDAHADVDVHRAAGDGCRPGHRRRHSRRPPRPPPRHRPRPRSPSRSRCPATGSGGANLRAEPATDAPIVQNLPDGTRLTVIGQDREADGRTWRNVRGEVGTAGLDRIGGGADAADADPGRDRHRDARRRAPRHRLRPGRSAEPAEPTPEPERVEVYGTGTQGANLRAQPGLRGTVLRSVPDGSQLTIVGENEVADGVTWRHVQDEERDRLARPRSGPDAGHADADAASGRARHRGADRGGAGAGGGADRGGARGDALPAGPDQGRRRHRHLLSPSTTRTTPASASACAASTTRAGRERPGSARRRCCRRHRSRRQVRSSRPRPRRRRFPTSTTGEPQP